MKLTTLKNVSLNFFFQIIDKSINNRKLENVRSYIFVQHDKTIDINFNVVILLDLNNNIVFLESFFLLIILVLSQKEFFRECFSIVFHVFHIRRQLFVSIVDIVFQILIDLNYNVVECNDIKIENIKFSLLFNSIISFNVIFFFLKTRNRLSLISFSTIIKNVSSDE